MSSGPSGKKRSSRSKSQAKTASTSSRSAASEVTEKAVAAPTSLFPVVGIGASAGGLTAVTELLKELRAGIGAAIVVIQHLDPEHGSLTREILSRITPLPVSEVTDGMRIEPGHVYVIPPNCSLRLEHEFLKLSPRAKGRQHLEHSRSGHRYANTTRVGQGFRGPSGDFLRRP